MTKKDKAKALADVCAKLPKGRALVWKFTEDNRMVMTDAKTGEVLSKPVDHPVYSRKIIAAFRKLEDGLKSGEITVEMLRKAKFKEIKKETP